ncbi:S-layer homology domain-containing protein [Agathobaculum sp. Marseille-P7918]|uniref:S-layer homology domain-containing protein n=1 Tax=Agathobaculum sp. Marseille-P7918 TaxID=2479843 RepID=UPI003565FE99
MKNLKKVLALVLAFACAFTMFAGAAFTDQADIQQTEAVDMLAALGVINGYTDGSFKPNETISRAEAAKMIYTIWNGGNDDATAFEGKSVFTDVYSGHWAEGYINFCYTNGIINGKGNSKFAPDDKVTGTELAKMLLICMGYQADKSGLTGTGYSQRTNALATQNGLYADVNSAVGSAMPRQYAAQLMYNALKAETVKWSADSNAYEKVTETGMSAYQDASGNWHFTTVTTNETMGSKCMDLTTMKDIRLDTVEKEDGRDTYRLNGSMFTRVAKDYSNLVGQNVNVMYKNGETDKVYGVYANEDSKVVAESALVNVEVSGTKVKVDGTEYKVEGDALSNVTTYGFNNDTAVVINGTTCNNLSTVISTANASSYDAWDAYTAKFMDNDGNGKIDHAVITPVTVGQVTYVGSSSINVTANGTTTPYKFADDNIYEGAARDDWAYVTPKAYTADDKNVIAKADVVTGEVTSTKGAGTAKAEVEVDGTWYKVVSTITDIEAGSAYDLVVCNGLVFDAQLTSDGSASNILYISAVDTTFDKGFGDSDASFQAKAYFADGSDATIKVTRVNGEKMTMADNTSTTGTNLANKMYTYSKNSAGNYEIKELANAAGATTLNGVIAGNPNISKNTAGYKTYSTNTGSGLLTATSTDMIDGKPLADDSIVFLQGTDGVKVVSGKTAKNLSVDFGTASAVLTKVVNGISYAQVACVYDAGQALPAGTVYGRSFAYLLSDPMITTLDGNRCTKLNVWTGNGAATLYVDSTAVTISGRLFSYETDGKYIKNIMDASNGKVAAVAITGVEPTSEGAVELYYANSSKGTYKFDKDVVIMSVNDSDRTGLEGASYAGIPYAKSDNSGKITQNAYIYYEGSTIYAIVYDVNNELDGAPEFNS